jgi:soluble lytic murein transglycosylase
MLFRKIVLSFFMALLLGSPAFAANAQTGVQQWLALKDSRQLADFGSYARFLNNYPGWPQENAVLINAEAALLRDASNNGTLVDWFTRHPPLTDEGRLRYILALQKTGHNLPARQMAREYWHEGYFDNTRQVRLLTAVPGTLNRDDHTARLNKLLWQGNIARAETLLPQLSAEQRAIAHARIALQKRSTNAASLMNAVSAHSRTNDEGLMFDRVRFARIQNNDDFAFQLISQYRGAYKLHEAQWWRERNLLARRYFEKGNFLRAYQLAAGHRSNRDADFAEAEWFAGWIALTRLNRPKDAFDHFERMYRRVVTPMSKTRGAYWTGRAAEALGQKTIAEAWYRAGAQHPHFFYGLMSAYALNAQPQMMASFLQRNQSVSTQTISVLPADLVQAARILHRMNKSKERDAFLTQLVNRSKDKNQAHAVIPLAKELGSTPSMLLAGKAAYEKGTLVTEALFPRLNVPHVAGVDPALSLAIMRQESLFDRHATSSAQARGLMQLLDGTAAQVARKNNISYNGGQSLYDPTLNMRLGQLYIKELMNRYDDFAPLSIAAYNAGPGNVTKFIAQNGDPRIKGADWVDWTERIPFYETRNYVQRVWEAYIVYDQMMKR